MDMKLELVVIPFSDMDRAKMFYADKLGFNLDHEHRVQGAAPMTTPRPSPRPPLRHPYQ